MDQPRPFGYDCAMRICPTEPEQRNVTRLRYIDLASIAQQALHIPLGVPVKVPVWDIERWIDPPGSDASSFVYLRQQHQAVDAGALDPRGVMEGRADPCLRLRHDSITESIDRAALLTAVLQDSYVFLIIRHCAHAADSGGG